MNNLDKQYIDLLQYILDHGIEKKDRTGTGTKSIFGYTIRHNMKGGFPLLTTKKISFRLIVTELLWFLRGDTNIKFLIDNDCHIWDGDAYKNYDKFCIDTKWMESVKKELNGEVYDMGRKYDKDGFTNRIKTDDEFAKKWCELGPVYGKQWRDWVRKTTRDEKIVKPGVYETGIDQIANLINDLKTNPDSRRLMVTAWNPAELDQMTLPPCHYGFQVYTRELTTKERLKIWISRCTDDDYKQQLEEAFNDWDNPNWAHGVFETDMDDAEIPARTISLMWNQRSVDIFLGLPFNIASYGLLLEIIAKSVNMVPDELIGNLGDTHLYLNHVDQAKEQIGREPFELPKLNINTEFWPHEDEGVLDALTVFNNFKNDNFCKCLLEEDLQLYNYQYHPSIKAQLSN